MSNILVDDPDVTVIAFVIEALKNPHKLMRVARGRMRRRKIAGVLPGRATRRPGR